MNCTLPSLLLNWRISNPEGSPNKFSDSIRVPNAPGSVEDIEWKVDFRGCRGMENDQGPATESVLRSRPYVPLIELIETMVVVPVKL